MSETDVLAESVVLLDLKAGVEEEVIRELVRAVAGRAEVTDAVALEHAVLERQKVQPPLLGHGIALPHARTNAVSGMVMAIGRCRKAVVFGPEEVPVEWVFLFGMPGNAISEYLAVVSKLTRLVRQAGVREALDGAENEQAVRRILMGTP
ncbi:MAG: PTS sugar transporter subunit IIA [Luteolibacter sp.]